MSSFYEFISSQYQVWDSCKFLDTDGIDVSEIWIHHASQKKVTRQRRVPDSDIDFWLNRTSANIDGFESSILLRLVWVKFQHMEKIKHISSEVLDKLRRHFHIELAHKWNWTCFAGSASFSDFQAPNGQLFSYSVCNHPKAATAWSHSPSTHVTQGIYFAESSQIPKLRELVQSLGEIASHPMLTALVFGITLSGRVEQEHKRIKESVRSVEARTRFHSWASRNETPAEGDHISLSSVTTGAKTRLANLSRKTKLIHELCAFIRENLYAICGEETRVDDSLQLSSANAIKLIVEYIGVLKKRTVFQEADIEFFQHRADAQLTSVGNILLSTPLNRIHLSNTHLQTALEYDSTRASHNQHEYCNSNAARIVITEDNLACHYVLLARDLSCHLIFCSPPEMES